LPYLWDALHNIDNIFQLEFQLNLHVRKLEKIGSSLLDYFDRWRFMEDFNGGFLDRYLNFQHELEIYSLLM